MLDTVVLRAELKTAKVRRLLDGTYDALPLLADSTLAGSDDGGAQSKRVFGLAWGKPKWRKHNGDRFAHWKGWSVLLTIRVGMPELGGLSDLCRVEIETSVRKYRTLVEEHEESIGGPSMEESLASLRAILADLDLVGLFDVANPDAWKRVDIAFDVPYSGADALRWISIARPRVQLGSEKCLHYRGTNFWPGNSAEKRAAGQCHYWGSTRWILIKAYDKAAEARMSTPSTRIEVTVRRQDWLRKMVKGAKGHSLTTPRDWQDYLLLNVIAAFREIPGRPKPEELATLFGLLKQNRARPPHERLPEFQRPLAVLGRFVALTWFPDWRAVMSGDTAARAYADHRLLTREHFQHTDREGWTQAFERAWTSSTTMPLERIPDAAKLVL